MKREYYLDYCKSLVLLLMIATHLIETFPTESVQYTMSSYLLYSRAIIFGATAFMLSMGWTFNYSKNTTPSLLFSRGFKLLVTGYLLNIARYITGYFYLDQWGILYELLNIDILHFAGLAMMVFAVLIKINLKPVLYPIVGLILCIIGSYLSDILPFYEVGESGYIEGYGQVFMAAITGLFYFSSDEMTCFPLFYWFVYPAVGYWAGNLYINSANRMQFAKKSALISWIVFISLWIADHFKENLIPGFFNWQEYLTMGHNEAVGYIYEINPAQAIYASSFIIFAFMALNLIFRVIKNRYPADNRLDHSVLFFSKNINNVFIIQWILIGNISPFITHELSPTAIVIWYVAILGGTMMLARLNARYQMIEKTIARVVP